MLTRRLVVLGIVLLAGVSAMRARPPDRNQFPRTYVPAGAVLYKQYCAACHGADAKGYGPARMPLKSPAANLTTLAERYNGVFPYEYVAEILRFGPGVPSHGSADMPTWGPIFQYFDNQDEGAVQQRIKNLNDYLASVQRK